MTDHAEPVDEMGYEEIVHDALRGAVVAAFQKLTNGPVGAHTPYLTFRTDHPFTMIPDRLKAQYPTEMTVVFQHRYWGLETDQDAIRVTMTFSGAPAALVIPLKAVSRYYDPHTQFLLQFTPDMTAPPPLEMDGDAAESPPEPAGDVVSLDRFRKR